jgi:hypothetical protein
MYSEIRAVIVLLALALAAVPVWMAGRIVAGNLHVLSSWKRTQGVVVAMAADDYVEIEAGGEPDSPRVKVPIVHKLGLSFLGKTPIYTDPADPQRVCTGGLLQMWLWPAGLGFAAAVLLVGAGGAARVGRGTAASPADSQGRWMFSAVPPPLQTDIRLYRPASEWKAPLWWSLLGAALLACGLFMRGGEIPRIGCGAAGLLFLLLMWTLALETKTTEVSGDASGMRKTTAFGWCQIRWDQLGSVNTETTIFGRRSYTLREKSSSSFPGRQVTTVVFADRNGRKLLSMSPAMQPSGAMRRLLDTCAERTGLHMEFRTTYDRNL